MELDSKKRNRLFLMFLGVIALNAIGLGLSDAIFNNYYYDVYQVTASQRGFIEFPRELPGVIAVVIISMLSFMGEIRLAIVAQVLSIIGLILLGLFTPPFALMLVFLFINSMGMHMFFPLSDGIGLNIIGSKKTGKNFGILNGVRTGAGFIAALIVFLGFRSGVFSFTGEIIHVFLIATGFFVIVLVILFFIRRGIGDPPINTGKGRFLFRKEYRYYYLLASLHGAHKQIAIVFGPWVLISILEKQADTLAALSMVGMFLGVFFMPLVGRLVDRYGVKSMMFTEGFSFMAIYILFGVVSAGFASGRIATVGIPVIIVFVLFIIDRMTIQLGMVRALYLRSIAVDQSEITPTLSTGMSLDHVISIVGAFLGGLAWEAWGPQFVFFIAAGLALCNVFIAARLPKHIKSE